MKKAAKGDFILPNTCMLGISLLLYSPHLPQGFGGIPLYGSDKTPFEVQFGISCTEILIRSLGTFADKFL
jgi:hypothetical protein